MYASVAALLQISVVSEIEVASLSNILFVIFLLLICVSFVSS